MLRIRLAAAAVNQTPLDWEANRDRIRRVLEEARAAGASVVCLPELCLSGYGCEDQFHSVGLQQTCLEMLGELLPATRGIVAAVGLPLSVRGGLYNGAALAVDGRLAGVALKQHLAGDGIHYEPRWFRKWPAGEVEVLDLCGTEVPVGDVLFDCGGVRIGFEICRDAWVADRPGARLADAGVDVILNPSASHFAFAKQEIRKRFVLEGSRIFHASFVYCNLLGNEAGRAIFDGGTMIASAGRMLVEGPRLSFQDHLISYADVDVDATRRLRAALSEPSRPAEPFTGVVCENEFRPPAPTTACPFATAPAWEGSPPAKEEEFVRAATLALFDYLRKSRSQGFVVSMSGGADSSAVAVLIGLMARLAVDDLGRAELLRKLGHVRGLQTALENVGSPDGASHVSGLNADFAKGLTRRLLVGAYQATRHSSATTLAAARTIAEAVGAEFLSWNVDELVDGYVRLAEKAVGREITWGRDDVTLQNVQARARGPGVWMLANLRDALLLTTSNRSEAAVGYATMDGDTCGGLAPLAGIDKAFLRKWLVWMEKTGPSGVGPLAELAVVNSLEPTAELRPPGEHQTDEGDLMPYVVLDAIERAGIRDKLAPVEVFQTVRPQFPEASPQQLGQWVKRFFTLWCRNQWKRERYAPSFHFDDENLDPRSWCRFPILSGGFERELSILDQYVDEIAAG
jgi:NAD+ synthase (glutamine-hydrolysing)